MLASGSAFAVDFTITRQAGDQSNAILIENNAGLDQFWVDKDGYVYANGTQIRINTLTCGGTDKFSSWDNTTGLFTCSADDSAGAPASIHLIGNVTSIGCAENDILKVNSTGFFSCAVDATGGAGSVTNDNIGSGDATVSIEATSDTQQFKRLSAGNGITLTNNTSNILINNTRQAEYDFLIYQDGSDTVSISGNGSEQLRSTDDEAVINNALAHLPSTGGLVHLNNNDFTIDDSICFSTNNSILEGEMGTLILYDGSVFETFTRQQSAIGTCDETIRTMLTVRDLKIQSTDLVGTALNMTQWSAGLAQNLRIDECKVGVLMNSSQTHYNVLENSRINCDGADGIDVVIDQSSHENTLYRLRLVAGEGKGVFINNSHSNSLIEVNIETNADIGIHLTGTSHNTEIIGAYLEGNVINLQIDSLVEGTTVIGGYFVDSDTGLTGDIINNGDETTIIGARVTEGSGGRMTFTLFENRNIHRSFLEFNGGNVTNTEFLDLATVVTVTINGGIATASQSNMRLDTEGAAGTDDLDTLNGLDRGVFIILSTVSSGRDVSITESGNFALSGATCELNNLQDRFFGVMGGSKIHEIACSDNGA